MEYRDIAFNRRSIRGYSDELVPKELIDEVIDVARQAPSSMNTQPWHFHVVTGEPLERIREGNTERMMSGAKPDREISGHGAYEGEHRERQKVVAGQLFESMGIDWGDKQRRNDWAMRGFRQFDAPVSIVGTIDRDLGESTVAYFDLGQIVYGMVLAAWDRGLGTVINGQGISQSSVVREHSNIPEDQIIVITVALGWPADNFPANDVQSQRREIHEIVSYVGFDERSPGLRVTGLQNGTRVEGPENMSVGES
ncbi:MAG: nitroreductase [Actinomycetota bacterium]|nr:nitroreductase [Actinomycetota bacterium]